MTRTWRSRISDMLEEGDATPVARRVVKVLLLAVIAATVAAAILETLDGLVDRARVLFLVIEAGAVTVTLTALSLDASGARFRVVLDTHSTSATGPVTSRSRRNGAVSNETPMRGRLPASAVEVHDALATPALVMPVAEYETALPARGASVTSAPSTSSFVRRAPGCR